MKPVHDMAAWQAKVQKRSELIKRVAHTPDGKAFIEMLKSTFEDRSLMDEDPHKTAYNLGQRDVVQFIRELSEYKNDE